MSPAKIIHQICSLLLVAVFLFGITGMSVHRHACRSSNTVEVTTYAVFVSPDGDGCCTSQPGYVSAPRDRFVTDAPLSVDEAACCKSSLSIFRLEFSSLTMQQLLLSDAAVETVMLQDDPRIPEVAESGFPTRPGGYHAPPGKAGKQLVLFLSQPKVPLS